MKKIIITLLIIAPAVANAANMCIKNDAVMVVLDPQINGTALSNNATGKTWSTRFSYGVISGIGGCYSASGGTQGDVASDQVNVTPYSTGNFCYCKMLKPVESAWVYFGTPYNCVSNCAGNCSSGAASAVALRSGLFGSVGI
ncbi:MAG: hypothetical protein J6T57_01225 [Alphaproteobacteria bacterium]|nr:hypothetical protein [Alphaproteobacteria bacterium]